MLLHIFIESYQYVVDTMITKPLTIIPLSAAYYDLLNIMPEFKLLPLMYQASAANIIDLSKFTIESFDQTNNNKALSAGANFIKDSIINNAPV